MAITLGQVAKLERNPLRKMVIMNLLRHAKVLDTMPFENVNSLSNVAVRVTNLPDVAWRNINEDYTPSTGDVEQVYEGIYIFGGTFEADRIWKKVSGNMIKDPEQLQVDLFTEAMAYEMKDQFINGDHGTNRKAIQGLKKRIDNGPSRQKVRASSDTNILDPTASTANARLFLRKWNLAFDRAGGGVETPSAILCNEDLRTGLGAVLIYLSASASGLLDTTKDQFDREIYTYKGVPIYDMGLKADQSTEIIPKTETAEDGGADATSAYFVPWSMEQGVYGIQLSNLEVEPGLATKSTSKTTLIEWAVGLAGFGSYGPTRLHNIENPDSWT
jgi:hypothetical protein